MGNTYCPTAAWPLPGCCTPAWTLAQSAPDTPMSSPPTLRNEMFPTTQEQLEMEKRAKAFVVRALGKMFYYRARGHLSALLREPFLGSYVLRGGFSALALNAPSDHGNSFAILPSGVLVLSLDRESFQARMPGVLVVCCLIPWRTPTKFLSKLSQHKILPAPSSPHP